MNVTLSEAEKIKILNSTDLYSILQRILLRENKIDKDREHFWVIGLGGNNRILFVELISKGTQDKTLVEPMEVFSFALQKRAAKIILSHNHPSGELKPSDADKDITDRLIQVGIIVETEVVDHLIISDKSYLSFADAGLMDILRESKKWVPRYKEEERIRNEAIKAGIEKGMTKGLAKGLASGKIEVVKRCLQEGIEIELIEKLTGLSVEEIKQIAAEIK